MRWNYSSLHYNSYLNTECLPSFVYVRRVETVNRLPPSLRLPCSSATSSGCPPFYEPVVGLSHSVFHSRLKNSPFLQVLSSIAFPNNPLARLLAYLTIAGVGTSLMEFSLVQCSRLSCFASFKARYNIVLLTYF